MKVLVLSVSRYQLDNGVRGGKISWTELEAAQNENRRGLEIYTAPAPFEAFALLSSVPCVADLDLKMKPAMSNGKSIVQVCVEKVSPLAEKAFEGGSGKYAIK